MELKFNRGNMVRAIGSRWKTTIEDFTETNDTGIFRHQYYVTFKVENDEGEIVQKEDEPRTFMPPNQGKTFRTNQDLPRFSKMKMRWMTTYVA